MPVSNPSYFPPNRSNGSIVGITAGFASTGARNFLAGQNAGEHSTVDDLIVIGDHSFDADITDAGAEGSVVIGNSSVRGAVTFADGPVTVLGFNVLPAGVARFGGSVLVGDGIFASAAGGVGGNFASNTIVGSKATQGLNPNGVGIPFANNVIAGFRACSAASVGTASVLACVIIGASANDNFPVGAGGSLSNCVIIGQGAGSIMNNCARNTLIGAQSATGLQTGSDNTCVGQGVALGATSARNTLIGVANVATTGGDDNTLIGYSISAVTGSRAIALGSGAGAGSSGNDEFFVETNVGGTRRALLYGRMGNTNGNLVIGNSAPADRDFVNAFNCLKLLNGAVGTAPPVGGGYFYVDAGALHWVGSGGTDTVIAPA